MSSAQQPHTLAALLGACIFTVFASAQFNPHPHSHPYSAIYIYIEVVVYQDNQCRNLTTMQDMSSLLSLFRASDVNSFAAV